MEPDAKKAKLEIDNDDEKTEGRSIINNDYKRKNEVEVGMDQFLSPHLKKMKGIIKQRYSDFMVRELNINWKPVFLDSLEHCDDAYEKKEEQDHCKEPPITDENVLEKIGKFSESEDKSSKLTLEADDDKEHRKSVHQFIKSRYSNIETDTVTLDNGSRAIRLFFKKSKGQRRNIKIPNFCHFTLFKQNKDTMEAINLIAKKMHCNPGFFGYAGTKDRRATTMQKVSVKKKSSKELSKLNNILNRQYIYLGNFSYSNDPIKLGQLAGNEFTIIVRNISDEADNVNLICETFSDKGFINYFGLQRFGTGGVPTHEIGKSLLKGNFKEAVDMILQPRDNDQNYAHSQYAAKKIWTETKDAEAALKATTNKFCIEFKLLTCLEKEENFLNAFQALPRNTRFLYVHSYQSYVWNKIASKRIEKYGLEPCVGDLVINERADENNIETAKVISQQDIEEKKYTIYDIVLPQPGYDMMYPGNELKVYFEQILKEDGLDLYDMKRKQKDLSLPGKYRVLLVKPRNISWEVIHYDDFTIPLMKNDVEKMRKQNDHKEEILGKENDAESEKKSEGKFRALKLIMSLPSSSYATSALRELLVTDSSFDVQNELNKQFAKKVESDDIKPSADIEIK